MQQTVRSLLKEKGNDVWSIGATASVFDAIKLMSDKEVGALVVMDGDQIAGIISERDYMRKVILKDRSSKATRVEEIMTSRVLCVDPDRTVDECMALMTEKRVRHFPVLEDDRLVGIVSIGDVVKAVIAAKHILISQLERYIVGH